MKKQFKRSISRFLVVVLLSNIVIVPDTKAMEIPVGIAAVILEEWVIPTLVCASGITSICINDKLHAPTAGAGEVASGPGPITPLPPRVNVVSAVAANVAIGIANAERKKVAGTCGSSNSNKVAAAVEHTVRIAQARSAIEGDAKVEGKIAGAVVASKELAKVVQGKSLNVSHATYVPTPFVPEVFVLKSTANGFQVSIPALERFEGSIRFDGSSSANEAKAQLQKEINTRNVLQRQLRHDARYKAIVVADTQAVVECFVLTQSEDLAESIPACLALNKLYIQSPLNDRLRETVDDLKCIYSCDGALNDQGFIQETKAAKSIVKFIDDVERLTGGAISKDEIISQSVYNRLIAGKNIEVEKSSFRYSPFSMDSKVFNNDLFSCLAACQQCDFGKAEVFRQRYEGNKLFEKMIRQYTPEDQKVFIVGQTAVYDLNGIVRVAHDDPIYLANVEFFNSATVEQKKAINGNFFVRNYFKRTMHEKWDIPEKAPECVHDAMYAIMGADATVLGDIQFLQRSIEDIVKAAPEDERDLLVKAFYLPNGVLKEYTQHFKDVKTIKMPKKILMPMCDELRAQLNDLMCEQVKAPTKRWAIQAAREHLNDWLSAKNSKDAIEAKGRFDRAYTNVFNTYPGGVPPQIVFEPINPVHIVIPSEVVESLAIPDQVVPGEVVDAQSSMPMPPTPQGPELEPENEIKLKITYPEAEAPELSKGLNQRIAKYKTVEGTGENCRIVRPSSDFEAEVEWAPKKWDVIRKCTDDVKKIARNTGWSTEKITRIKEHVFYEEHMLRDGKGRFAPDPEIASAWDRLYRGDFIKNDIQLLEHEFFESRFESLYKTGYEAAHEAAIRNNKIWPVPSWRN